MKIRYWAIQIIIFSGIAAFLCVFWELLEIWLDGGIHTDNSDNVIATILTMLLQDKFIKWAGNYNTRK